MGYIKVKHRALLNYMDNYSKLPNKWAEFVRKQEEYHNLIIKEKGKCTCTNCNYTFTSKKKVNQIEKCPNCKNSFLIKRGTLTYYKFEDYLAILDKVNDTLVIRYFELFSSYNKRNKQSEFNRSIVEFARVIPNEYDCVFVNDRVSKCQCYIHINHLYNPGKWRLYTRSYSLISNAIIYPYNMKSILKDTQYKYSMLWDLAKHSGYINLERLLEDALYYPSIEMLIKMKLYRLTLEARKFVSKGNFEKRFGVPRDFYSFMKRHNITYKQLEILQLLKEKDIKKIKYLENFNVSDLQDISRYISINRFIRYAKSRHRKVQTYLYKDYLKFASFLGFDLKNNKYAFPKDLRTEHDKLEEQYEIQSEELIKQAIVKRGQELSKNTYKNNKFIVFPAHTLSDLIDESKQQHNCVRTYAEDYAAGDCDIYFMRDIKNKDKSLVTVEVKHNNVVQSRIKYNESPNKKQVEFLDKWEEEVLREVA